ncbi:MAG: DUF4115 domain-containing protein [Alphaproteobacteria bacterium]|nr:DUF4115 domain-containing protein [Alphaproteobacteria bacterium]MDE2112367.1 DUF4115 domain-containing protein [Alphaproteobacteria bacterium]MDE2492783.1 DUF4115 domain-containing protein [Alphaproteobacteria bacterium]
MTKVTRLTLDEEGGLNRRRIHLREISGDLDAPLETVGQDLRAARLRRGDDLATVSRVLKIRKDHLEALEEDRIEALPGRTYAVGFVRSYADYLGLDAVQCVERFKAEIAGRTDDVTPTVTVIDEDEHRRLPQGWKIIAGVVLVIVLYGAYQLATSADRMLEPITAPPPEQLAPKPVAALPKQVPTQPAQTPQQQPSLGFTGTLVPQSPTQQTTPVTAAPADSNSASGLQPSGVSEAPLPQGHVYGEQNKNPRLILRMRQVTRILVQGPEGMVYINRTLQPGDSYRVPNLVGLTLTTSDAGAVELDLDGQAVGLVGKAGQTVEALSLDPQSVMDRYNNGRSG